MGAISGVVDMIVIWLVHFLQTTEGQNVLSVIENDILAMAEANLAANPPTEPIPTGAPGAPGAPTPTPAARQPSYGARSSADGMVTPTPESESVGT